MQLPRVGLLSFVVLAAACVASRTEEEAHVDGGRPDAAEGEAGTPQAGNVSLPLCKGEREGATDTSPSTNLRVSTRFPPSVLRPVGAVPLPVLSKQAATLVGTRTLDPAQATKCASPPFDATTTPCSVSTVVQLRIGDGGLTEALVSLPRERIDAFGKDVPVRVPQAPPSRFPWDTDALTIGPGVATCETFVDSCQRKFVGQELNVVALGTTRSLALEESAEVTVGADVYRIWHRSASRRVRSGSKYAECADLTPSRVSFDVALLPPALADAGSD